MNTETARRRHPAVTLPRFLSAVLLAAVGWAGAPAAVQRDSEPQSHTPKADPRAIIHVGNARFTILTSRLVRMEWSADRTFEDRASLVFLNRHLPVPRFDVWTDGGWTIIRTQDLTLRYRPEGAGFAAENLRVDLQTQNGTTTWTPGMPAAGNLKGTIRTLDGVRGATPLEDGLLSRDGWTVVDDSRRPLLDESDWPWVVERPDASSFDWYFFGYGRAYREWLRDFTLVAGKIPLPPRFAFGIWWSRYWAYTDKEFQELVREFQMHNVPLDVLVIDMDWHQTFDMRWDKEVRDQAGERLGWTGYTWDSTYFPDPRGFLQWCGEQGLKTPLNLHPASGIQPHEVQYPEMARAMGIDPASGVYVPFDITNKKFALNYLAHVIHPLEGQGVDFWWLDWQQWSTTTIPGVTPTWWLNYVFFTDMERRDRARPLLFHRWGGLGNHRYQVGFSGDAISEWESLAFQPYFTATASNVCFGYWSHDIGGHMPGPVSGELYLRWIQFGVFSPILRTHTTKNPNAERRIWAYPHDEFLMMRDAFLLRSALIPYLYTMSRLAYDTGVSVCRPMYYDHPLDEEAYAACDQYMFGDAMLVAPVTGPIQGDNLLAEREVWLPEGDWIEWCTGARLRGPRRLRRQFALDEIPVYVKAGSIIPMQPEGSHADGGAVDPMVLTIFPGDSGSVRVYEDQGNSLDYQQGLCSWTPVRQRRVRENESLVEILPVEGGFPEMPRRRSYRILLERSLPPEYIQVGAQQVPWSYDGERLRVTIALPEYPVDSLVRVTVVFSDGMGDSLVDGFRGSLARLRRVMPLLNAHWPREWSPPSLVHAAQTGTRMSWDPSAARAELEMFASEVARARLAINAMRLSDEDKARVLSHLSTQP